MPLDTHVRVAAWLHIVLGVLATCVLGLFALFFGAFGAALGMSSQGSDASLFAWLGGIGVVVFLVFMTFPVLEIVGGVLLLRGSPAGKVLTIVISVLGLINFPIGTAIGIYSLWALLREAPLPATAPVPMQTGAQSY